MPLAMLVLAPPVAAQVGPVYPDDSITAREGLARAAELATGGNVGEAARVVQGVLDADADAVLESPGEQDIFIPVRRRAHELLLQMPALLEKYRALENAAAQTLLDAGQIERLEKTRLLTRAGFDAALRLAQEHIESARFEAARLTLEQLEEHPDRRGTRAVGAAHGGPTAALPTPSQEAARTALTLARYIDRAEVRAWAERWASESALPGVGGNRAHVGAAIMAPPVPRALSPLTVLPTLKPEGLVSRPLQTVWLSPDAEMDAADAQRLLQSGRRAFNRDGTDEPWVYPSVVGDVVYTNDGRAVAAWDRFTLQPLWRSVPAQSIDGAGDDVVIDAAGRAVLQPGRGRDDRAAYRAGTTLLEDSNSTTIAGDVVVATTGLAVQSGRDGDARLHAFDAATGRVLWSTSPAAQSPSLATAVVRGPAIIDGDMVIVQMRKPPQTRRMAGAYLAALDVWTGKLRWARLLGSAGAVYQQGQRIAGIPVCDRGIVYCTDEMGVTAAIEAMSGRVVWVKRTRSDVWVRAEAAPPWSSSGVVIDGEVMYVISAARDDVQRFRNSTGRVEARRRSNELGDPRFLLRAGAQLCAVGADSLTFVPLADFESAVPRRVLLPKDSKMQGRPVVSDGDGGPRVLVPTTDGLVVIDPAAPDRIVTLPLEFSGNAVAIDSHVVVAGKGRLHSYLVWDVAERMLGERIAKNPNDPRPALTLTELAYRSGRFGLIAGAADRAIDAIGRGPVGSQAAARQSLYDMLRVVVQTAVDGGSQLSAVKPGDPRPGGNNQGTPASGTAGTPAATIVEAPIITDVEVLDALVERIGRLASSPSERVEHLMALGRLREELAGTAASAAREAAAAYQRVLNEPELASATWNGPRQAVRADLEATQRLRDLVKRSGRSAYSEFEGKAAGELARLQREAKLAGGAVTPGPDGAPTRLNAEECEILARRFPAATAAPELWSLAAEAYEGVGRHAQQIVALGLGLSAAEWAISIGDVGGETGQGTRPARVAQVGELAGRLVRALDRGDRSSSAAQLLDRVVREYPGVVLTVDGVGLDATALSGELSSRIAGAERRARLGRAIGGEIQVLDGWVVVKPLPQPGAAAATEHVVMISRERRELALFGALGEGTLKPLWVRGFRGEATPVVVGVDARSVLLFWPSDEGGSLERIDAVGGAARWRTPAFAGMFPTPGDNDAAARVVEINTPLDGRVKSTDLLITMDEQTAVLAERSGRMAAFDLTTGRTIWTATASVQQVYDIAAGPGAGAGAGQNSVLIAGAIARAAQPGEASALEPTVAAYDLRSGKLTHQMKGLGGDVYWIRTTPGGDVIVGLEHKVASVNLPAGTLNWEINDVSARQTPAAWVFGDRLYVQASNGTRNLWVASVTNGSRNARSLDPHGRLDDGPIRASALGRGANANAIFLGRRGLVVFDAGGSVVGMDSLSGAADMLPPELGDTLAVALETARVPGPAGPAATLSLLESASGRMLANRSLVMHEEPRELALLDGRILVSTDSLTLIIPAPIEGR